MHKTIYLLIGQKGSGKSTIGHLFEKHFNIPFIRVEDWVKAMRENRKVDNSNYIKEAFGVIEKGIIQILEDTNSLVFESTGLTGYFDKMLSKLKSLAKVILIKVSAHAETCLERVKSRDQKIHINVSDEQVNHINQMVAEKEFDFEFEIDNNLKTQEELVEIIRKIVF